MQTSFAQNEIAIKAVLNPAQDKLLISQKIIFKNTSDSTLTNIYLHNWANSYSSRRTPLSNRLIKDFKKDLYFAKIEDRGNSEIKNLTVNDKAAIFQEVKKQQDVINISLITPLEPNDSLTIDATYIVKLPQARFTGYGKTDYGYYLRNWYLTTAVYDKGWQYMSNLNLDDLFESPTNFTVEIDIPKNYFLKSNIYEYITEKEDFKNYYLVAKNKTDLIISISGEERFKTFKTKEANIYTNVLEEELSDAQTTALFEKQLSFLKKYLGKYPHKEIFIDRTSQQKNPIYGLSQLPSFLKLFTKEFKYETTILKALIKKYIDNTIIINHRKDAWISDGIQNYLMIEYIEKFYPDKKLLGKYANKWYARMFNFSKLDFNDKYPFIYEFSARQFLDQSLTTPADSLSNFNQRIVNKYKAGLGFTYLKGFLGADVLNKSLEEFYQLNSSKITSSKAFEKILRNNTDEDLDWFFNDFLKTNKKIDYTLDKVVQTDDSVKVTIKNKRNITAPVALYGLKNKEIKLKTWIPNVDDSKEVTIPKNDYDRLALNFENLYPEYNTYDNWKKLKGSIFNKPLKFSLIKDTRDPYYSQIFYQPNFGYNFYNGIILGVGLHNKPIIKRNIEVEFNPSYAIKSKSLIGSFNLVYNQFFEKTNIYKIVYGVAGQTLDYAPNLSYRSFVPFTNIIFKRKNLRDATFEAIRAKWIYIDKEVAPGLVQTEEDKYGVFSLSYNYINPDIIKEFRQRYSLEFGNGFSKVAADIRYRTLTASDTQLDFRIFAGAFLNNSTTSDYFSFGLDRANDYLFELGYFGRSEQSGFFSQQFIIAEGGFKSVLPTRFANQYMVSLNSSFGLWKWVEFYNDVAFLKNRNQPIYFAYNNGIRLNFVHNIFEVYFPLYSNNGWEIGQDSYSERIRFTLTTNFSRIFNFFRRGFF